MSTTSDTAPRLDFYDPDPPNITPETRAVLEKYSKIPPDEVIPHVTSIVIKQF